MDSTRLFVGNLPAAIRENDLKQKFTPYVKVIKVELKERKFLQPPSCFAFVTVTASKNALEQCIYDLSDECVWNGHPVTVDFAKESFLSRLEKERLDPRNKNILNQDKPQSNNGLESLNVQNEKSCLVVNRKKIFSKEESSVSENSDSSDSESDDKTEPPESYNKAKHISNNVTLKKVATNSESSESDSSKSSDSESDKKRKTAESNKEDNTKNKPNLVNSIENENVTCKLVHNGFKPKNRKVEPKSRQQNSDSESDEKEINISTVVNQSNNVMKQFEQFHSVWQDSNEDDRDNQSDSSDSIFEAFKLNPNESIDKIGLPKTESFESRKTTLSDRKTGSSKTESFLERKNTSFPSDKSSESKEENFVKFVKTRQPQVQSKLSTQAFAEVKVSGLPNKKIVFDSQYVQDKASDTFGSQSRPTRAVPESNPQFFITKVQAKNYADAESKRRIAMEERIKQILDKKNAIKHALANVDTQKGGSLNKKLIFNFDEEDTGVQPAITNINHDLKNGITHLSSNARIPTEAAENEGQKEKKSLFNESDSEDDSRSDVDEFKIKKQFEGERGLKLLELQATYNNDTRFNLDNRFAEDEEEESDKKRDEDEDMGGDGGVSEKEKQMQILESVLGYRVKQHQTNNGLQAIPRFDPLHPDTSLIQVKAKSTQKFNERKRKRRPRDDPVPVSDEKFYQLDAAYFTEKKSVDEPFSLLKMLNRDTTEDVASIGAPPQNFPSKSQSKSDDYHAETLLSSNRLGSVGARFEYDSSDSEDDDESSQKKSREQGPSSNQTNAGLNLEQGKGQFGTGLAPMLSEKLFLFKDDDRFKEAQEFLRKSPSNFPASNVDTFKLKRRELALKLKTKVRRSMKNSGLASNMKRKKITKMMKTQRRR